MVILIRFYYNKSIMEKGKIEFLKGLLEQSWLHIRHPENNRLWFTNMCFLMVAGVLT